MKKSKILGVSLLTVILICACSFFASATIWEFGASGSGQNEFVAKGFAIKTENGKIQWLFSKFDNGGYDASGNMNMYDWDGENPTTYTGIDNGVQYINTNKADGTPYQLYAFTNRNPKIYYYMFAYQKKSENGTFTQVSNFTDHLGSPVRTSEDLTEFPNGITRQWAIPINSFTFEPGTRYEFGFYQGMQANNGITLTLAEDGSGHYYGYYQNPQGTEYDIYEKHMYTEYQFISSYELLGKDSVRNYYDVNFVPMRFSVQTFADLTAWNNKVMDVQNYLSSNPTGCDNIRTRLNSLQKRADNIVKYQLQTEADVSINSMINIMDSMIASNGLADNSELVSKLAQAASLYNSVKDKTGTKVGDYGEAQVNNLNQAIANGNTVVNSNSQSDIDAAADNLDSAMATVNASRVKSDKIILNDSVNGIKVILKSGSVPDDVSMVVVRLEEKDVKYKTIKKSLGNNVKNLVAYRILLYSGDKRIQPTSSYTIQFPVQDSMSNDEISLYYASDNLNLNKISSKRTNSSVLVENKKNGYFSLVTYNTVAAKKSDTVTTTAKQSDSKESDSKTSTSDTKAHSKSSSGKKTKTVDVIKQTDQSTNEQPDVVENALDINDGAAGNQKMSTALNGEDIQKENVPKTSIPKDEIQKESDPVWALVASSALGAIGISYGLIEIIRKLKR